MKNAKGVNAKTTQNQKKMSEKDVVYALELLHTVQLKREALDFASFVHQNFRKLSKEDKDKLWTEYLKHIKK